MNKICKISQKSVLVICNQNDEYIFSSYLSKHKCIYVNSLSKVQFQLTKLHVDILLLYINLQLTINEHLLLNYLAENFPNIYSIAILKEPDCRVSHFLGANSIKEVLTYSELDTLETILSKIQNAKITLDEFSIFIEKYPANMQKMLDFIEKNYLNIFTITEIANYIGINECTVSREFQKNELCPPKKLLMYFKIKHSIKLLTKTELKIKEIACLSGFTNEQRYIECFVKMFDVSPSKFKDQEKKKYQKAI